MSAVHAGMPSLPDFDFRFELDAHSLGDAIANHVDQLQHILGRGSGLGDKKIGVPLADFDAADPLALEAALIDQHSRAHPARDF